MDKKQIQCSFIEFPENHYPYAGPKIMASNAFDTYNNDIGMSFWNIFEPDASLLQAKCLDEKMGTPLMIMVSYAEPQLCLKGVSL